MIKKLLILFLSVTTVICFAAGIAACSGDDEDYSAIEMEEGIVYITDFSVQYSGEEESPHGNIDESTLSETKSGAVQSYYMVMEFDMQTASDIEGMEYLTIELTVLDANVVDAIINFANTSSTDVKTSGGQTSITATYSLPDKAKLIKNVQLVLELKPQTEGVTDIIYSLTSDNKDVIGYDETDCTYTLERDAVTVENTSLEYTLNADGLSYSVTGIGSKGNINYVIIKSYVRSLPVTAIGDSAFYGCNISDILIPDTVVSVGRVAFYNTPYYNDKDNWQDNLLYIDNYLIDSKLSNEESITVKSGTTVIACNTFYKCGNLNDICLPESISHIGEYAFYGCTSLGNITIPYGVEYIGDYTFCSCRSITEIELPDSIISVGSYAFYGCTSLTQIYISKLVTEIAEYTFCDCGFITYVIPDNITTIGKSAFENCTYLTSLTFSENIKTIENRAFYNCTNLTEIYYNATSADDLESNRIFYYGGLSGDGIKVTIGSNVSRIPERLFYSSSTYNIPKITEIVFEDGSICESIGTYAFAYCKYVESITLPDSITTIDSLAFCYCSSLTDINIPEKVDYIGILAFNGCTALTSVTFGKTSGWWVASTHTASSGTKLSLDDVSTNATYLTITYKNSYWHRG